MGQHPESLTSIVKIRWVLFLIVTVYPAWWWTVDAALDNYYDPFIGRVIVSAYAFAILLATYVSSWVRRHTEELFLTSSLALIFHLAYLTQQNNLNYVYAFGSFLAFFSMGLGYERQTLLLTYIGATLASGLLVDGTNAEVHKALYMSVLSTGGLAIFITFMTRKQIIDRLRDNTNELKVTNAALKDAIQARTALFANVSHELRTPLTLILGQAAAIRHGGAANEETLAQVTSIERNAKILLNHVGNFLSLAQSESGGLPLMVETFDLAALCQVQGGLISEFARMKDVSLTVSVPHEIRMVSDAEKVEGILVNLLTNAVKYTPFGGKIELKVESTNGHVHIAVEDSGPGIPIEQREAVFDRFVRLSDSSHTIGGTGLGLSIVRQYASILGGTVTVSDSALGGARFDAMLPTKLKPDAPHRAITFSNNDVVGVLNTDRPKETISPRRPRKNDRFTILFVEDHPELLAFLLSGFETEFNVVGASNGIEAIEILNREAIDVICSDLMMPDMDGRELFEVVRGNPAWSTIPVIFLTAREDDAMRTVLLEKGAQDFLAKPVNLDTLRSRILSKVFIRREYVRNLENLNRALREKQDEISTLLKKVEKARDAAVAANEAKSLFLANISHELRTPLAAISGYTELLATEGIIDESTAQYTSRLRRNCDVLTHLIDDLLLVTKIDAGRLEVQAGRFKLDQLIEDLEIVARKESGFTSLVVKTDPPDLGRVELTSDYTRVFQVVANLVKNAVKFGEGRPVDLLFELKRIGDGTKLVCEVKDRGIGILAEDQDALFHPFHQVDNSLSRRFGGTGLGLYLSKKIATVLGGDVRIKSSSPAEGSVFVAEFSIEAVNRDLDRLSGGSVNSRDLKGRKGIIVEDSPDQQFLLEKLLIAQGASVAVAGNGLEGIELINKHRYDFVIMDIQMPDIDGIETVRRLRAQGCATPIVILTAHGMRYEEKQCLRAGATKYLTKPVNRDELLDAMQDLFPSRETPL